MRATGTEDRAAHNERLALFSDFADLCRRLAATSARLEERRLTSEYLRALEADDVARAVDFLTGRTFPVTDPRALLRAVDERQFTVKGRAV